MLRTRIIPCLQLIDSSLVKTVQFNEYGYIGDPVNTVRIFNELEVDELCLLDIRASLENREPNYKLLEEIANECFMPLSYGGGIRDFNSAASVFNIGFEKVVLNTSAFHSPDLVTQLSEHFGSQAIVGSIDVKKTFFSTYKVYVKDGREKTNLDPVEWAVELEELGAGELLVTSMDREGTWQGFDLEIIKKISKNVSIPVIANGGAGTFNHIFEVVKEAGASAVALGSMVVYQKKGMGVLVNFPDKDKLGRGLG